MAGIARSKGTDVDPRTLRRMAWAMRHRGPDGAGVVTNGGVGLAHVRLSVLDVAGGTQPMWNEDGTVVVVFNGEIFNFRELRRQLSHDGRRFHTKSDTEVLLRAYERWGTDLPRHLNGQFAFAIHDRRNRSVFLARDRFGMIPLFYAERGGDLYFASEIKGLLASDEIEAVPDPEGLDEIFTFWAALPPRTAFREIKSLEPGRSAIWRNGRLELRRYHVLEFAAAGDEPSDALERMDELMQSAVDLRLVADVPVSGYLSGGLDSSSVCALASRLHREPLRTFSVSFDDPRFDESGFQQAAAAHAGSTHSVQSISQGDIARVFPDVVRHTETPILRTAPAPMFLLSRLVREQGLKVALTGEGADETFLGYDLYKDTVVRLFCLRRPQSVIRPRLFDRLYPDEGSGARRGEFWGRYFLDAGTPDSPLFSHLPRFQLASWVKGFYSHDFRRSLGGSDAVDGLLERLPARFSSWTPLARATWLEMRTLLSSYLLSSQGDRMAMAHGVETRTPFLDHRLVEFAVSLPERTRLCGLRDKRILRRWAATVVPKAMAQRPKKGYRAPDVPAFFGPHAPEYVNERLSPRSIADTGVFDPRAVIGLLRRCKSGAALGTRESQALVGILSTQIWHHEFITAPQPVAEIAVPAFLGVA